jgi:Fe-S-cluster containining protein
MSDENDNMWAEQTLTLSVGEVRRPVRLKVATRPQRPMELLPVLQLFQNEIVAVAEEAIKRQGKSISCRAGCGACCRQLVPVSEIEARHIARLVADLPPKRRKEIKRRFRDATRSLIDAEMAGKSRDAWQLGVDKDREELGLDYFKLGIACPFLENEACSIHRDRPLACREFLVTSPAENCATPTPETVQSVDLPARLSYLAYRFSDGEGQGDSHWFPLTLALEWFEEHKGDPEPLKPGHEMLRKVLEGLAGP